jgi:hypothetical protein
MKSVGTHVSLDLERSVPDSLTRYSGASNQRSFAQTMDESQSAISCIGELHAVYPGGRRPSLEVRTFSDYFAAQLVQKDATDQGV